MSWGQAGALASFSLRFAIFLENLAQGMARGAIALAMPAHLSPVRFEHINPFGKYYFPIDQARNRQGLRSLRAA